MNRDDHKHPKCRATYALLLTNGLLLLGLLVPSAGAQTTATPRGHAKGAIVPLTQHSGETWTFDESTTGADIAWTSPTAVNPAAPAFLVQFSIETIEVSTSFLGIPLGAFDVTDQVPPELLMSSAGIAGPAPISLVNQVIVAPPPPEPLALGATLDMGINADGHAQLLVTNIVLGTTMVDAGPPFGVVTVNITGFRIAGTISITPLPWRLLPL